MEHGALGEARVRAILLERFWVLHRSVDVDGTDYLVQVRPRSLARFLDAPIQLVRIQAKFVEHDNAHVYVPRRYVLDGGGMPYPLFFLLLSTGRTEAQQLFVLDATEIARDFQVGSGNRANYFSIPAMKVFRSGRYEVASQTLMLDRIERAILEADRPTRSNFFGVVAPPEIGTLDADYTIPLANWYGDFGDALREVKQGIRAAMYDMEDTLAVFRKILASGDPVEAEVLLDESAVRDFLDHGPDHSLGFSFGSHSVLNEDLFGAARDFRRRLDRLRAAGLEVQYVRLFAEIDGAVQRSLRGRPPTPVGRSLSWTLTYDPVALSFGGLTVRTLKRPTLAPWPARSPVLYLEDHPIVSPGKVVAVRGLGQFPPDPPAPRRLTRGAVRLTIRLVPERYMGRALHRHAADRVGLRPTLSLECRAAGRPARLPRFLQSAPPAHRVGWPLTLGRCQ